MVKQLQTIKEVITELGGPDSVRELTGREGAFTVPMWKNRKKFPSDTYLVMKAALDAKGVEAPASLWGITVPTEHA
jgi:hypothetical protein